MNKLTLVLFGISLVACNPSGNKAIIPVEEKTHHETSDPSENERKQDSTISKQ